MATRPVKLTFKGTSERVFHEGSNPHENSLRLLKATRLFAPLFKNNVTSDDVDLVTPGEWADLARMAGVDIHPPPEPPVSAETIRLVKHLLDENKYLNDPSPVQPKKRGRKKK